MRGVSRRNKSNPWEVWKAVGFANDEGPMPQVLKGVENDDATSY